MNVFGGIALDSDFIEFDKKNDLISAYGDVVVKQENNEKIREMHCEKVEYNIKTQQLKLFGEILIKEPTGEIVRAKKAKIDLKLKNAIIKALKIVLSDSSKLKADLGTKENKTYTFENASYTPCDESNCLAPLWNLEAQKVVYDVSKKTFVYHNVRLKMKGHTIAYLPYFKHPSFGVKRQSGFLSPIVNSNNVTGFFVGIPYFIALDDHKDLTLTPFINSKRRGFASGRYRQSFYNGDLEIGGSVLTKARKRPTTPEEELKTRYHFDTLFQSYDLKNKRIVMKIERASDMTYKIKYPVSQCFSDVLTRKGTDSKISVDFFDRNFFVTADSHIFQTPDKDVQPFIVPHLNLDLKPFDENIKLNSDLLYLERNQEKFRGTVKQMFRFSNKLSYQKSVPIDSAIFGLSSGVRFDTYNFETSSLKQSKTFPIVQNQISAFVPFSSKILNQKSIWGPKVVFSSVECSKKRRDLNVNEDSIFSRFDDQNIFNINRINSFDRIDIGERIAFGIENSIYNSNRRMLNFFVGKSKSFGNRNSENTKNSTVGKFVFKPFDEFSIRIRFVGMPVVEKNKLFESGMNFAKGRLSIGAGFLFDSRTNVFREKAVSQFGISAGYGLSKFWKLHASQIFNLKKWMGHRNLSRAVFINYQDECFGFGIGVYQSKYKDRDINARTGFVVMISFKNLADLGGNISNHLYKSSLGVVS